VVPERDDQAIRELLVGNYRIVYRLRDDTAEILTVFHGARLFPSLD
jgi:toxin ParE1/3/4